MAGQYGDITSFLPKDGVNYDDVIGEVMGANAIKKMAGLGAEAGFNNAVTSSVANVKNMFLQGEIEKSKAKMQASNILGQANMNKQQGQKEPSTFDKILGYGSQAFGIASGLGAFSGGGGNMGGKNYWDPMTGKGVAGPNFGL